MIVKTDYLALPGRSRRTGGGMKLKEEVLGMYFTAWRGPSGQVMTRDQQPGSTKGPCPGQAGRGEALTQDEGRGRRAAGAGRG